MRIYASIILAIIFFVIAILHIYWVLGGKWGLSGSMPEAMKNHVLSDSKSAVFKTATLGVAAGLFGMMYLFLVRGSIVVSPVPANYLLYATYAVLAIFTMRAIGDFKYCGFFKSIKDGDFAKNDSKYFSPLCLFIALLTLLTIV